MNIGTAAKMSGVRAGTIRYYEAVGFLPPARRSTNGYRTYTVVDIDTLKFIKSARGLGFSIDDVREMLVLSRKEFQTSGSLKAAAARHKGAFDQKIDDLNALRRAIVNLAETCQSDNRPGHPCLYTVTPNKNLQRKKRKGTSDKF